MYAHGDVRGVQCMMGCRGIERCVCVYVRLCGCIICIFTRYVYVYACLCVCIICVCMYVIARGGLNSCNI